MSVVRLATVGLCVALSFGVRPARAEEAGPPAASPETAAAPLPPPEVALPSLRTADGQIVLAPGGRLQVDGDFFPRQTPKSGLLLRRAQLELRGWLGPWFYFDLGGDFAPGPPAGTEVAPSALPAADDYLAVVPFGDRLIVQAGQFDAPFTLENRTSDAATDFLERSMTARSLGAPRNKEIGAMAHGRLDGGLVYYSAGLFNGEGPGFRNLDNQADAIGRVAVTPFVARGGPLGHASIGGSAWIGDHVLGPEFSLQATPGGVTFFEPRWTSGETNPRTLELHEQGTLRAFAGELCLPLGPRFGLRGEVVWKRQQLTEADASLLPAGPLQPLGNALLDGIAVYGEIWYWLLGDDRLLPPPGYELPRERRAGGPPPAHGLMLALKGELLKEDLTSDSRQLGDPSVGTTRVVSATAGLNYWWGPLVRLSADYILDVWSGSSQTILALRAEGELEQEVLLRFAMSL